MSFNMSNASDVRRQFDEMDIGSVIMSPTPPNVIKNNSDHEDGYQIQTSLNNKRRHPDAQGHNRRNSANSSDSDDKVRNHNRERTSRSRELSASNIRSRSVLPTQNPQNFQVNGNGKDVRLLDVRLRDKPCGPMWATHSQSHTRDKQCGPLRAQEKRQSSVLSQSDQNNNRYKSHGPVRQTVYGSGNQLGLVQNTMFGGLKKRRLVDAQDLTGLGNEQDEIPSAEIDEDQAIENEQNEEQIQVFFQDLANAGRKGKFAATRPVGRTWQFGEYMMNCPNILVQSILIPMNNIGCLVCQGYGHSKNQCPTEKQTSCIAKGNSLMADIRNDIKQALKHREYMVQELSNDSNRWCLLEFIRISMAKRLHRAPGNTRAAVREMFKAIEEEFVFLETKTCIYCGGWGHIALDNIRQKEKVIKQTLMDRNLDGSKQKKTPPLFKTVPTPCPTKVRYEQLLAGSRGAAVSQEQLIVSYRKQFNEEGKTYRAKDFGSYIEQMLDGVATETTDEEAWINGSYKFTSLWGYMPAWERRFVFEQFPVLQRHFAYGDFNENDKNFYLELLVFFYTVYHKFVGIKTEQVKFGPGMDQFFELYKSTGMQNVKYLKCIFEDQEAFYLAIHGCFKMSMDSTGLLEGPPLLIEDDELTADQLEVMTELLDSEIEPYNEKTAQTLSQAYSLSFTDGGEKVVKYGQVHFVKSKSEQMLKRLREIRKKARENRKQLKADQEKRDYEYAQKAQEDEIHADEVVKSNKDLIEAQFKTLQAKELQEDKPEKTTLLEFTNQFKLEQIARDQLAATELELKLKESDPVEKKRLVFKGKKSKQKKAVVRIENVNPVEQIQVIDEEENENDPSLERRSTLRSANAPTFKFQDPLRSQTSKQKNQNGNEK